MAFPEIKFGKCQICGSNGGDDPAASGSDATARDTVGNGVPLEEYEGVMACKQCIQRLEADKESLRCAERHAEEEAFLQTAGFRKTVE